MDIESWVRDSKQNVRADGWDGVRDSVRPIYAKGLMQLARARTGTSIYDREWDLLIVLDACRYDLFCLLAHEYDFTSDLTPFPSVNTATERWMELTFPDEPEVRNTAYITGNPFSERVLDPGAFQHLDEVWRDSWTPPGTVRPRPISDRLIRYSRENDAERTIAHYMQPHCPFLSAPELSRGKRLDKFGNQEWLDVWGLLREDEVTASEVWEAYRENLRIAMDEVAFVLEQVDAETVVVTSDHGNAMGELGVYGHPPDMPHRCLWQVPWVETTARDTGTYEPSIESESESIGTEEKLRSLGYL